MIDLFGTWQFNVFLYLICIVSFFQFYKLAVRNTKDDGSATIILQLIAAVTALSLFPFFPVQFPSDIKIWALLCIATVFYCISDRLQTPIRKQLEVSVVAIVGQISTVFLLIYGFLLFKDPIVPSKIAGAAFILFGNILLQFKKGSFQVNKYVLLVMLGGLAYATAMSIDIGTSVLCNLPIYIFFTLSLPALFLMILERKFIGSLKTELLTGETKYFFATGISWGLAIFFSLRAFQLGSVSTIVPLQASSVLLNV
ncbi:MAG TPA: hypothetical protein PLS49_08325, partial [Candidatus Woesebacteria bacterium]|nr:hypothetical protein [Candidatus Woesebacteria bacterium]